MDHDEQIFHRVGNEALVQAAKVGLILFLEEDPIFNITFKVEGTTIISLAKFIKDHSNGMGHEGHHIEEVLKLIYPPVLSTLHSSNNTFCLYVLKFGRFGIFKP